jgi:hypothetical protein
MLKLNYDCLIEIIKYLDLQGVLNLSKCNKYLNLITWKHKEYLINCDVDKLYDKIKVYKDVYIEIGFYDFKIKTDIIKKRVDGMRVITYNSFNMNRLMSKCEKDYYKCVVLNSNYYSNYLTIILINKDTYNNKGVKDTWTITDYNNNFLHI